MSSEDPKQFEHRVTKLLDEHAAALDTNTLSRLRRARSHALQQDSAWWRRITSPGWIPAGAVSLATVAVLSLSIWLEMPKEPGLLPLGDGDLEIIASGEDLQFFDQLEFYRWLEQTDDIEQKPNGKA